MANLFRKLSSLLLLLVASNVAGCYDPSSEIQEEMKPFPSGRMVRRYEAFPDPMGRPENPVPIPRQPINENAWGQSVIIQAPFTENQAFPVIEVPKLEGRIPKVQNMTLGFDVPNQSVGATTNYIWRWRIRFGVGGGTRLVEIDAGGFQQLSVSAERMTIEAVIQKYYTDVALFNPPTQNCAATVFAADGSTSTDSPTFTTGVQPGTSSTTTIDAPVGATAWRITGDEPAQANSPFDSDVVFSVMLNGLLIDSYLGSYLDGVRLASVPLGPGTSLRIVNNDAANAKKLGVEWSIDL
jgi:hypothetical protein